METLSHRELVQRWGEMVRQHGWATLADNLDCESGVMAIGDTMVPYTKNEMTKETLCYTVSTFTHYYHYLREEMDIVGLRTAKFMLIPPLWLIGFFLRFAKVDKAFAINNFGLSTNLFPKSLNAAQWDEVVTKVQHSNPKHAILVRSVNRGLNSEDYDALIGCGFKPMFARNVLLFPFKPIEEYPRVKRRQILRDEGLGPKLGLRWLSDVKLDAVQAERVADLYDQLYLGKYSKNNPRFTSLFHFECSNRNILHYQLLLDGDRIVGALGMKVVDGVSTMPILGYDHHHPQARVLYRILTAQIARTCSENNFQRHASSGANKFKILRGGVTNEEFTMVKTSHLSLWRRLNWGFIRWMAQKIGRPLTHKFET
ncbi:MAG: hypothetical protein CMB34_00160 [Euryarchaeota archaeon]|nr:hypothetical protein [Euryarchaeota archaeon]